jgi:hypothetical protein
LKVIIDFDGTLTAEEEQAVPLARLSLRTLANEIIGVDEQALKDDYRSTRARLLANPHKYWWEVNGLVASYCNEGAFILNTTTLQVMLSHQETYLQAVARAFPQPEYDAVVDCTNYLFHRHTAELPPRFRPAAQDVLNSLAEQRDRTPLILTNSLGDKVNRYLGVLDIADRVGVLGDTRQYEMDPTWRHRFSHPRLGEIQVWPVVADYPIDLRRPAYYRALVHAAADGSRLAVVADTFSLPGALPLMMGIPFFLLRTPYTPDWCVGAALSHPLGQVLEELGDLPARLDRLAG